MIPFVFQGGLLVTLQTKKNHITNLKSALRMVLISLLFHAGSCHVKIVPPGIIVPPFSEREPLFPLMLFFRGETTKISFPIFLTTVVGPSIGG